MIHIYMRAIGCQYPEKLQQVADMKAQKNITNILKNTPSTIKTIIIILSITLSSSCASTANQNASSGSKETETGTENTLNCKKNKIIKSKAFIDHIFQDILNTYSHTGGGGVTSIKEVSTNTFEIYIAQEERIDVLLYELKIDDNCTVEQLKKSDSTISFGQ